MYAKYSYAQDMAIFRTKTHWFWLSAAGRLLVTAPLYWLNHWLSDSQPYPDYHHCRYRLNILTGYCGQLSIGHAGFMAVGAYTSAILMRGSTCLLAITVPSGSLLLAALPPGWWAYFSASPRCG